MIDVLGADLAVCIENRNGSVESSPFWKYAKYKFSSEPIMDWGKAIDKIGCQVSGRANSNNNDFPWRNLLKIPDLWLGGVEGPFAQPAKSVISYFYKWLLLNNILRLGLDHSYDFFVITRSDLFWENSHPPVDLFGFDKILVPDAEGYGGICDRHAVVPKKFLSRYLGVLLPIVVNPKRLFHLMKSHARWNSEKFLHLCLHQANASVSSFPCPYFCVRTRDDSSNWSLGALDVNHGFFVKYPREKFESGKVREFLNARGSWQKIKLGFLGASDDCAINGILRDVSGRRLLHRYYFTQTGGDTSIDRQSRHVHTSRPREMSDHLCLLTFTKNSGQITTRSPYLCSEQFDLDLDVEVFNAGQGFVVLRSISRNLLYCSDRGRLALTSEPDLRIFFKVENFYFSSLNQIAGI